MLWPRYKTLYTGGHLGDADYADRVAVHERVGLGVLSARVPDVLDAHLQRGSACLVAQDNEVVSPRLRRPGHLVDDDPRIAPNLEIGNANLGGA